jgi:hypothetical protein
METIMTNRNPQDQKHVQGQKQKEEERRQKQQQAENPDRDQQQGGSDHNRGSPTRKSRSGSSYAGSNTLIKFTE